MPTPFTLLKTSPSANKDNSSGDSCQWFCNVLCETKCPESSNKCCAQRQVGDGSKKWWSAVAKNLTALRKNKPKLLDHKNEGLVRRMCSYMSAVPGLWCRAGWQQCSCQKAGESTKHQELSSAAFPTCLASTWVGVNKDLLKEYKQGPPGAITLNLPFQVLSINTVPQSNPAGTL